MKLVVIGGVAAGMSAAARARRLDETAEIVVLEKGHHVSFANCGLPYHIGGTIAEREQLLLQTPNSLKAMLNLDVRVGHEVTAIDPKAKTVTVQDRVAGTEYTESYEKLALCPGATPLRPKLPGIDLAGVKVLRNVDDMDEIKAVVDGGAKAAVVIGGGYIGVEMAENLRERGLRVDLVEMVNQLMPPLDPEMTRALETHMRWHGVNLHLGDRAAAFRETADGVSVELVSGKVLTSDIIILAAGVRADSALAVAAGLKVGERGGIQVDAAMQTSDPDIYAGGDAVEVVHPVMGPGAMIPLAGPANRQGRTIADSIYGRAAAYPGTLGTSVVKVFEMTAGGTGVTEKWLKSSGRPYRKVYLHPAGHAGYYPGTAPMHVKVLFTPDEGKLLGAQVVGYDGVDKRLDVLATAMRGGMTVRDLCDLELAYAPPYGSAKDPVNMVGFIASNLLDGDVEPWHAEDYPTQTEQGLIVDVRGPQEYELWHIPGSINLPLQQLRSSTDRLPRDKTLFLYCKVGFRSYLAYRALKQLGFEDVKTLSGGSLTFCSFHDAGICGGPRPGPVVSYAEDRTAEPSMVAGASGKRVELDCCGLQCPGPIRKVTERMQTLSVGDELVVKATDPGFATDVPAWCKRRGHTLVSFAPQGGTFEACIRKGAPVAASGGAQLPAGVDKKTMVVFSGDLDKLLAAFIIANGAASMGSEMTLFFTFWGLNALRRNPAPSVKKGLLDRMFGWMMPTGAGKLVLSKMHMMGMGTAMMKHVMASKNVETLPELMQSARANGVKLVACAMSMDVMGITQEELIPGVVIGGVASFLGESDEANMTLFV